MYVTHLPDNDTSGKYDTYFISYGSHVRANRQEINKYTNRLTTLIYIYIKDNWWQADTMLNLVYLIMFIHILPISLEYFMMYIIL